MDGWEALRFVLFVVMWQKREHTALLPTDDDVNVQSSTSLTPPTPPFVRFCNLSRDILLIPCLPSLLPTHYTPPHYHHHHRRRRRRRHIF